MNRGAWSSQSQGVTESDTTELLTLFTLITHRTSFNSLSGSTEILFFMALFGLEEGVSPAPDPARSPGGLTSEWLRPKSTHLLSMGPNPPTLNSHL